MVVYLRSCTCFSCFGEGDMHLSNSSDILMGGLVHPILMGALVKS